MNRSRISDRPVGKEAALVVIYGLDLGKKFNVDRPSIVIRHANKYPAKAIRKTGSTVSTNMGSNFCATAMKRVRF